MYTKKSHCMVQNMCLGLCGQQDCFHVQRQIQEQREAQRPLGFSTKCASTVLGLKRRKYISSLLINTSLKNPFLLHHIFLLPLHPDLPSHWLTRQVCKLSSVRCPFPLAPLRVSGDYQLLNNGDAFSLPAPLSSHCNLPGLWFTTIHLSEISSLLPLWLSRLGLFLKVYFECNLSCLL